MNNITAAFQLLIVLTIKINQKCNESEESNNPFVSHAIHPPGEVSNKLETM